MTRITFRDATPDDLADIEEQTGRDPRADVLAAHLDTDPDDITPAAYGDNLYDAPGRAEYLVLTDDEADDAAREYVEQTLWAFNADFLAGMTGLPERAYAALSDLCEDANETVAAMVAATCGIDKLTEAAIAADGRGHFLAGYDGEEVEEVLITDTTELRLYLYRVN